VGRKKDERGASLVEFALLLPVLALILFGIIDFGTLYNNYQSVRQGARDSMRQAVVAIPQSPPSCTVQGGNVTASGTDAYNLVCYTKARVGLGDQTRVRILWKGPPSGNDVTAFPAGNPVMVCVQYPGKSTTGLLAPFLNNKVLNTQAETLIEVDNNDANMSGFLSAASGGTGDIHENSLNSNPLDWGSSCDPSKL
jgi:hypothetical protein